LFDGFCGVWFLVRPIADPELQSSERYGGWVFLWGWFFFRSFAGCLLSDAVREGVRVFVTLAAIA
jgi:hypothetical protein